MRSSQARYDRRVSDSLPDADLLSRAEALRSEIATHNRRYHTDDAPTISDAEYDTLVRELRELEDRHPDLAVGTSPTQQVGGPTSTLFAPVRHRQPMTSLDNAFSLEELVAWGERLERRLTREGSADDGRAPASYC